MGYAYQRLSTRLLRLTRRKEITYGVIPNKIKDALELYNGYTKDLVGCQKITTHYIFDIKLGENFRRKSILVADGHKTQTPKSITYSSEVACDPVRICLLLAALNDLDIQAADIKNAYLTAPWAAMQGEISRL